MIRSGCRIPSSLFRGASEGSRTHPFRGVGLIGLREVFEYKRLGQALQRRAGGDKFVTAPPESEQLGQTKTHNRCRGLASLHQVLKQLVVGYGEWQVTLRKVTPIVVGQTLRIGKKEV